MSRVKIAVQGDGMRAVATASAGAPVAGEALRRLLAEGRVARGRDDAAIAAFATALLDPTFRGTATLAVGEAPVAGEPGRVEFLSEPRLVAGELHPDGSIDFRERTRLVPVLAGRAVGRVVAPTAGTPGFTVDGRSLPATPGKPHAERFGPGLREVDGALIPQRDGALFRTRGALDVVPLYVHPGDLDYAAGNLHSEGSVQIRGDVRQGFTVDATGDIFVEGAVFDGHLRARGSIVVAAGVLGRTAVLRAAEDVRCRHATSADLAADGLLAIDDQASNCRLAGEHIELLHGRATVTGGVARARSSLRVGTAGSPHGTPTRLCVGGDPEADAEHVRRGWREQSLAGRARQQGSGAGEGKRLRQAVRIEDRQRGDQLRRRRAAEDARRRAVVEVRGTLHGGVDVEFAGVVRRFSGDRHAVRLVWDAERYTIVAAPLTARKEAEEDREP